MLTVEQALQQVLAHAPDYGSESVPFMEAQGRVLAAPILADRDLPPFNRVAMDGIAIQFETYAEGRRRFKIDGIVGAGSTGPAQLPADACLEIMTGAALPNITDTVVPYEQLHLEQEYATILQEGVRPGQNIHRQGSDHQQGDILVRAGYRLGPVELSVAASSGQIQLNVKKLPRMAVFSSGNELVAPETTPDAVQIRQSNIYAIQALLAPYGIKPILRHLPDDEATIRIELEKALREFDVLILSGGISAGKFDYIPDALSAVGVQKCFQKVRQRPGKPFWFGTYGSHGVVFALPGNPVSTIVCMLQYVLPWLQTTQGYSIETNWVQLGTDLHFEPALTWYLPVRLYQSAKGTTEAHPVENHGSGDYASLISADGFLVLPAEANTFAAGAAFPVLRYR